MKEEVASQQKSEMDYRNREIKFRAWDKGHNKMVYKVNLYSLGHPSGKMNKAQLDNKQAMNSIGFDCEIMQYTGQSYLGKDLYESDIVEIEYHDWVLNDESAHGIINPFNEDQSKLIIRCICTYGSDSGFHLNRFDDKSNGCYSVQFGGSAVKRKEIIGNIYENP